MRPPAGIHVSRPAVARSLAAGATVAVLVALVPSAVRAQRWQEIGKTSTGNTVYVNPASVVKRDSIVTATVRVVFAKPTPTPKGPITGSRSVAMFNCVRRTVAVKENIIWHDERKGTIYEKRTPAKPGFGPVFNSTFSGVAMNHLCGPKPPTT